MRLSKVISCVLLVLFVSSCATIFKGSKSNLALESDPAGAQVFIDGHYMGDTPLRLKLESKRDYAIEFRKEGYLTKTVNVQNKVGAMWIVLDVLAGLVPVIVDAATGSWYELNQDNVKVILDAKGITPVPESKP